MLRNRLPQAAALFVALTTLASAPAHAQFGGLMKKAKQAAEANVEKKVDKKVNNNVKPSSAFGEELTESSYASVARGLNAELAKAKQHDRLQAAVDRAQSR